MMEKEINPAASLVLDFGGSGARGIGLKIKDGLGKPILLCLDPEVEPVHKESIDAYESGTMGSTEPENRCWIAVGSEHYAIGRLARERFKATPDLKPLKWEDAVTKTLAAVWVLSQKLNLGNRFSIAIGALLPPGEYKNDAHRFESTLKESLSNFSTPSGRFKVKLEFFDCKPEGGGIYLHRRRILKDLIKQKVLAVVMIGHRNARILIANKGSVGEGITSDLGCNQLVDIFIRETSGTSDQPKDRIITALVSAGASVESKPFLKLARSTSSHGKSQDVEQMVRAAHLARSEYFRALTRWIDKILPLDRDEIVFCGGTAHLFQAELSARYIRPLAKVSQTMGLNLSTHQIAAELDLNKDDAQQMTSQLRTGIVEKKPEVILEGKVELDELYLIAGFKGQPVDVRKRGDLVVQGG